jgi:hypothetical protein
MSSAWYMLLGRAGPWGALAADSAGQMYPHHSATAWKGGFFLQVLEEFLFKEQEKFRRPPFVSSFEMVYPLYYAQRERERGNITE